MNIIKRTIIFLFAVVIGLIVAVSIWLMLPYEKTSLSGLLNKQYFILLSVNLDLRDKNVSESLYNIFSGKEVAGIESYLIKASGILSHFELLAGLELKADQKKPDYLILMQNNRLTRLGRLAGKVIRLSKKKKKQKVFYSFYKGVSIISNKNELIQKAMQDYLMNLALDNELDKRAKAHKIYILISNRDGRFTEFITAMQDKASYLFFPTIKDVDSIECFFDNIDKYSLKGTVVLAHHNRGNLENINKDLDFLLESVKRVLLAQDMQFSFTIVNTDDDTLRRNMSIERIRHPLTTNDRDI